MMDGTFLKALQAKKMKLAYLLFRRNDLQSASHYLKGAFQIIAPVFGRWGHPPRLGRGWCPHQPLGAATI